ncbi:hypothetical protein C7293_30140 [filamentous cyanobacterium CCT1]|nr:hypothetical protein C7293_30140 [filamentous cyanobacterium CCT1]PSN75881.1 hypothetical protein C8B47_30255 [filamentous cyanobacterium CCP4]
MKRLMLSLLSTAAVFGAIAPMAQAMPTRLENLRQADLNHVYLDPRQAALPNQGNPGTGTRVAQGQPSDLSLLDQLRRAHRNQVYLSPRQASQMSQTTPDDHEALAQVQQSQNSRSRLYQMYLDNLSQR